MLFVARHAERAGVFLVLVILEGVFWTPTTFFAGPRVNSFANDPYSTVFFAALIAFVAIVFVLRAAAVLPLLRFAWPVLPLLCLAFISAEWSGIPSLTITRTTKVALTALFGIYLMSRGDLGDLVALFVKVNLVAVVASFAVYALAPKYAFSLSLPTYATALRGAFSDKNALGLQAGLGVMFSVYAFANRYGSRVASGIAIPANLALLVLSQSKTPQLLLLVALYFGLLAFAMRRHSGLGIVTAFLLIVLGFAGAAVIAVAFGDVMAMLGRDPTLSERTRIWGMVMPYIERRPWLGYGFGGFWTPLSAEANQVWTMLAWKAPNAHNVWLQVALDLGVVGCLLVAFAWLAAFGRAVRLLFTSAHADVAFPLALLAAIFVENFTEYAFFVDSLLWALFCALLVHLGRELAAAHAASRVEMAPRLAAAPLLAIPVQR